MPVGGVERGACRAGASVFVGCSFCVRSRPVWRSSCVGSCGVRARRQIARRHTDAQRACLRTSDGREMGGHWSDLDESSYPKMGGGARWVDLPRTGNGHATGYTRTIPLRTDNGRQTDRRRTSDRRQMGGHSSDADILRHSEMGGGMRWADLRRASDGRAMGGTRTGNGRYTDDSPYGRTTGF